MISDDPRYMRELEQRLADAQATIDALLSGQIDAVVDSLTQTPLLLGKAQSALRESEERYRRIVETASEGISILDENARLTFVNRRFAEMLGYSVEEMLGMPLDTIVPESARAAAAQRVERSREGISQDVEVPFLRRDGSQIWIGLRTSPIRDSADRWIGTLGMSTDRTHYKAAEEARRASDAQYRQIVEATSDGIVTIDAQVRIVFVNHQLADMLGYEPREMIGASLFDFTSPAGRSTVADSLRTRRSGARGAFDTTYRHKSGADIPVNVANSPLHDADGRYIGSLKMVRDVTERNRLQSQLMISDRMASVGTLAAGVAHEINNPLAAVIGNLEYIAETVARPPGSEIATAHSDAWIIEEIREPLDDARNAAERVRFIVRDLKIFSRSSAKEVSGPVDVNAIMDSSLRMAWNEVRHRARLVKDLAEIPTVDANEARLGQVFLNLVVNAAQAITEGNAERNEILVRTRLEGERVIVEVSDTGVGIPAEIIARVFDAFFTTKAAGVGTGLGLAICQRIVTDLGGELTVTSEVGKGTTFRVSLPVAGKDEIADTVATPQSAPTSSRRGRVLVVDDDALVARTVSRTLAREHDVISVTAAREALERCAAGEKFDLILCDLMMPDMTGMDLHRELVISAPDQADRMIFLTGGAFTAQARAFLSDTPKEHLEKPFDPTNLRAIIQRFLR